MQLCILTSAPNVLCLQARREEFEALDQSLMT
jgi:hypothetical protein